MADAAHSGNAGLYSSSCGHWSDFAWQKFVADPVSSAEMVSNSATNSRPLHRRRAAPGALSQPKCDMSAKNCLAYRYPHGATQVRRVTPCVSLLLGSRGVQRTA